MKTRFVLTILLAGFVAYCAVLVIDSGLFCQQCASPSGPIVSLAAQVPADKPTEGQPSANGNAVDATANVVGSIAGLGNEFSVLSGTNARSLTRTIGSVSKDSDFKLELVLTSKGAAIEKATLSEFDDRDPDDPQPLIVLSPITDRNKVVYSLANSLLQVSGQDDPFPLYLLHWQTGEVAINYADGSQSVEFVTTLKNKAGKEAIRLTKTYRIFKDSYNLHCDLQVENLSDTKLKAAMSIQGPGGTGREDARRDTRDIAAGFMTAEGIVKSSKIANAKLRKAAERNDKDTLQIGIKEAGTHFIWAATTSKYFAAILRPVPQGDDQWPTWAKPGLARYYDPELNSRKRPDGNENISFMLNIPGLVLGANGEPDAAKTLGLELYLGPKDKSTFDKNELYSKLGYFHTIHFMACCCPKAIINPLAFGIMALMKWLHYFIPNYGVVIMILVVLVRAILHPVTKKSQVSMMAMQKLGPQMEAMKNKYKDNPAEIRRHVGELYRNAGVNPAMGILPMLIQMPIWIALWTSVYSSIELRGAAFLPFWITDLSAPDALIRFKEITIPLLGWHIDSFNLLPLLMGVVMFLQQKMMPHASGAQTNPQVAQQQKMMMFMMPLLFPIMLYSGPSGVNLYIMSSMAAGVAEQAIIRKHIRQKEEAESVGLVSATKKTGGKSKKKKPKPFTRY